MAKTGAFYFLFEKRNQKTFRAEGLRKCLESRSVLCFLLSVVYNVFTFAVFYRRNKVVLRRAVVNAIFFSFVCLICSSFGCITKHLMSGPSGN